MSRKKIGQIGEELACKYLLKKNYEILERNYYTMYGEVDIIALKEKVLVFVEVKTRRSDRYGKGRETISFKKQRKIKKTAIQYLVDKSINNLQVRFDVIEITINDSESIYHIKNAFN